MRFGGTACTRRIPAIPQHAQTGAAIENKLCSIASDPCGSAHSATGHRDRPAAHAPQPRVRPSTRQTPRTTELSAMGWVVVAILCLALAEFFGAFLRRYVARVSDPVPHVLEVRAG